MISLSSPTSPELLKQRIMRRVYFYWFISQALPTFVAEFAILFFLALGIHEYVSVRFVAANAIHGINSFPSLVTFTLAAFRHTEFIPRLLFGASAFLGILILRDVVRAARRGGAMATLALARSSR